MPPTPTAQVSPASLCSGHGHVPGARVARAALFETRERPHAAATHVWTIENPHTLHQTMQPRTTTRSTRPQNFYSPSKHHQKAMHYG